jgi:hypothetical protein
MKRVTSIIGEGVLGLLLLSIFILNTFGGIVGGVWLLILGQWRIVLGGFLAAVAAEPVYKLLDEKGLGTDKMPPPDRPILNTIGFFMHTGGHGTLPSDWDVFLKFMQMHLKPEK